MNNNPYYYGKVLFGTHIQNFEQKFKENPEFIHSEANKAHEHFRKSGYYEGTIENINNFSSPVDDQISHWTKEMKILFATLFYYGAEQINESDETRDQYFIACGLDPDEMDNKAEEAIKELCKKFPQMLTMKIPNQKP